MPPVTKIWIPTKFATTIVPLTVVPPFSFYMVKKQTSIQHFTMNDSLLFNSFPTSLPTTLPFHTNSPRPPPTPTPLPCYTALPGLTELRTPGKSRRDVLMTDVAGSARYSRSEFDNPINRNCSHIKHCAAIDIDQIKHLLLMNKQNKNWFSCLFISTVILYKKRTSKWCNI